MLPRDFKFEHLLYDSGSRDGTAADLRLIYGKGRQRIAALGVGEPG